MRETMVITAVLAVFCGLAAALGGAAVASGLPWWAAGVMGLPVAGGIMAGAYLWDRSQL